MKKILKKKNYFIAFIIPCIICLIVLYFQGVLKDIEEMYQSDLRLQQIVFLNYLKNVILGNNSLYYSFSAGLGNSMLSTLIFYCISPINFLLFLIKDIRYAILSIYIAKLGLAGLTSYILLKTKFKEDRFITVIFSSCYALCTFVMNYFFCGFWLDSLYLAPLVILGIDQIVQKKKISLLYIFSLALAIICNIQMGFGLCIFSVIYFIYCFNLNYNLKKDFKTFIDIGKLFAISSLCAGAISSASLLGFASSYGTISSMRGLGSSSNAGISNIFLIIKNLFTVGTLKSDFYNNFEPYVYCGLMVSFLGILFLFNKNIDKNKRFHSTLVVIVFIISFCINAINVFWHLSSPVLLNFRYSIYMTIFMVMFAYECYIKTDKFNSKDITILSILLLLVLAAIISFDKQVYILTTFIFLILNFVIILLVKNKNKKFEILLIPLVLVELVFNGNGSFYTASELPFGKVSSYDSFKKLVVKNEFEDSYRIMHNYSYTDDSNDTILLTKNSSPRYFSSIVYGNLVYFYEHVGSMNGITNYRMSAFDTPLITSLLGTKYYYLVDDFGNGLYEKKDQYEISNYDYVIKRYDTKKVYLYENPYAPTLGYMIENDVKFEDDMNYIDYQNAIIKAFTGSDKDVMIKLDTTYNENDEGCTGNVNSQAPYCALFNIKNDTNNKIIYVYSPFSEFRVANKSTVYNDVNRPLAIYTLDNNISILMKHSASLEPTRFLAATYNRANLIESLEKLRENELENVKFDKNVMTAEITAKKDGKLFIAIPYDKNFTIFVDDKEIEYYSLLDDAFLGLDLTEGHHDIKLVYKEKNFKYYVMASIIAVIVTLVIAYIINKKNKTLEIVEEVKTKENVKVKETKTTTKKPNYTKKKHKKN